MMARSRVEKIESSIKGNVVAQITQKTLILGPNGIGKSAIVNAVELAGTGRASDVAGRATLAKDADLFMLAPPGAEKVWATARFTGGPAVAPGAVASWTLERGHRAKRVGPEISFPLRDVQAALLGSPETARKWILENGGGFDWKEVLGLVPTSLHRKLGSVSGAGPEAPASQLTAALESAKTEVRECNARAKAARSLSPPAVPPPTPQDFTAIEAVIQVWKARGDGNAIPALEGLQVATVAARALVNETTEKARTLEAQLRELPAEASSLEIPRAAVLVIEAMVRLGATSAQGCAICGAEIKNKFDLAARAARGRARIESAIKGEEKRRQLNLGLEVALAELNAARRALGQLETELSRAEAKASKDETPPPDLDLEGAEAKLRELHTLRAGWEAAKRSEEQALAAERDSVEWTQLAEALSKAMSTLVEKARAAFCARVQRFLPASDLFGVDLLDGDREVLRVGLLRLAGETMVLHAALSGAEWARVTAALALATAPATGPCVVCPEERAFDPGTLSGVLAAFDVALGGEHVNEDAPQIIVTSPIPPREIPPGWTVILLGENPDAPPVTVTVKKADPSQGQATPPTRRRPKKPTAEPEPAPPVARTVLESYTVVDGQLVPDERAKERQEAKISSIFD